MGLEPGGQKANAFTMHIISRKLTKYPVEFKLQPFRRIDFIDGDTNMIRFVRIECLISNDCLAGDERAMKLSEI